MEPPPHGYGFDPRENVVSRDSPSRWGLYLVDQLADRWGVSNSDGTSVWFEIDRRLHLVGEVAR